MSKQTENDQLIKNMTKFLNKRVLVMPPNRHKGNKGTTVRAEVPTGKDKAAMIVKLDSGLEIQVYNASQLLFITTELQEDRVGKN